MLLYNKNEFLNWYMFFLSSLLQFLFLYSVISIWLNILVQDEPCLCVCVYECVYVCVYVCLYGPPIATLFGRFLWNLEYVILAKIWDHIFFKLWHFCSSDVITAILRFFFAALSHLQFLCNFPRIYTLKSLIKFFV